MLLLLPLSSGVALAASSAMQLKPGSCHESTVMSQHDMNKYQMLQHNNQTVNTDPSTSCAACGACLLACHAFADFQSNVEPLIATAKQIVIFTPEIFISHISAPLLPPPLARA